MLATLNTVISRLSELKNITFDTYSVDSIITSEEYESLCNCITATQDFFTENAEVLKLATERQEEVLHQIEDELAEARKKQGWIQAGVAVLGIAATVLSFGTCAPLAVASIPVLAYNGSNLWEGAENIYYGSIGDPYTTALNPIRDTIFQGDQNAYEIFGLASQGLYSLAGSYTSR